MVVINDAKENQFLQTQIETRLINEEFWIGLKETYKDSGAYKWVDTSNLVFGSALGSDPWSSGEPNSVIKKSYKYIRVSHSIVMYKKYSLKYVVNINESLLIPQIQPP